MNVSSYFDISPSVLDDCKNYFKNDAQINRAIRLFRNAKISISYQRNDKNIYYIISGIIKDDRLYSSKVIYKERLKGAPEGPLSSSCDCHLWNEVDHCPHVISLFIYYNLSQRHNCELFGGNISDVSENLLPTVSVFSNHAVSVLEYGTIVKSASRLEGAPANANYTGLQYLLCNNKIINFPQPVIFSGKLIVSLLTGQADNLETNRTQEFIRAIKFKHRDEQNNLIEEVSVLENLYLFDWKNGKSYHLPTTLRDFVQKIRTDEDFYKINYIINFLTNDRKNGICEIEIDGKNIEEIPQIEVTPSVVIVPGKKKNLLRFELSFVDENDHLFAPPTLISSICFRGGLLDGFRKKNDAYVFIHEMIKYLKNDQHPINKHLNSCFRKRSVAHTLALLANSTNYVYDHQQKKLIIHSQSFVKELFENMYSNFSEIFFRFAEYDCVSNKVIYQITSASLFNGMAKFYNALLKYKLKIFYNRNQISSWSSKVKFERRSSATKWFDLELNISEYDWEIINSVTANAGLVQTSNGLVLINSEQQELLKFIKKYTRYESTKFQLALRDEVDDEEENGEKKGGEEKVRKFILPFNRARIFELFELKKMGVSGALTEEEERLCEKLTSLSEMPHYEIPKIMQSVLRPYQAIGFNWLRFLYENKLGACLADDMGLGKTLQAIAFIESIYDQIQRVLIICPVTILINWEKEIQKFSKMKSYIYHGGERKFPEEVKIILTSYGVMKKEAEDTFTNNFFDVLILDEVQNLKNIRSLGSYAARKINAGFKICMTGTPVENDLAEFYNILDLSVPGLWGDLQFIKTSSTQKTRLLARRLAKPFILRRTKDQVLFDLPPKIENTIYLEFSDEEKKNYYGTLHTIKEQIQNSSSRSKYGEILKGLLRLRQSCLWQKNVNIEATEAVGPGIESTKINFLIEQLSQIIAEGHRVIVFSQFTTYLDIIQEAVAPHKWSTSRIDGSQTITKRQAQVDDFQAGKSVLFLISLKAGGVGLNLTAASYVFIMDPWWNPAVETQAVDRAHRIGQLNRLNVYRPIIKDSVEEKVLALQAEKKELFKDLLDDTNEDFFTGRLTMKDFEHLLS